jgi:hypothetical protein
MHNTNISNIKGLIMTIIRIVRIKQHGETTVGKLTIDGENKTWFVLEPGGPDSKTEGSDKRISVGTYSLSPYSSAKYIKMYTNYKMCQVEPKFLFMLVITMKIPKVV